MKRLSALIICLAFLATGTSFAGDRILGSQSVSATLGPSQQVTIVAAASNIHGLWVRSAYAIIYASGGDFTLYANNPSDTNTTARALLYIASPCCAQANPNVNAMIQDTFFIPPGVGLSYLSSAPNGHLALTYDLAS